MSKSVSREPKYLPEDGTVPAQAKFACRTCKLWVASSCGKASHLKQNPAHEMYSTLTGKPIGKREPYKTAHLPTNGHRTLDATARDMLLDYVLAKAKTELNDELDRMFRELKSAPIPQRSRRVFVAR
jgi:hypothetical protein